MIPAETPYLEQDNLGRWTVIVDNRQVSGFLTLTAALDYSRTSGLPMRYRHGNDKPDRTC